MRLSNCQAGAGWLVALLLAFAALTGCEAPVDKPQAAAIAHPLDPLSSDEYARTKDLLRAVGHVDESSRFTNLEILDPAKAAVLAWRPGDAISRSAFAIVKQGPRTYEAVVDLTAGSVTSWTEVEGVQPSLLQEEIIGVSEILAADEVFVAALAARGFAMDEVSVRH